MGDSDERSPTKEKVVADITGDANESTLIFCGVETEALIDSGSMVTTVSEDFLNDLRPKPTLKPLDDFILTGPDGKCLPYMGYIEATISTPFMDGKDIFVPVLVMPTTRYSAAVPVVVGTNVIRLYKEKCQDASAIPPAWGTSFTILERGSVGIVKSTNEREIAIRPMETITITGFVRKQRNAKAAVTEPTAGTSTKMGVCPRVVTCDNPGNTARVPVRIFNMSAKVINVAPHSPLCELHEVKVLRSCDPLTTHKAASAQQPVNSHVDTPVGDILRDLGVDLSDANLTAEQKDKVTRLFNRFEAIFSKGATDLGNTDIVKHVINLTDDKPFKEPYRRVAPALIQEIREHLAEMIEADAIRPSDSPYSSNVVIVRKKDGTIRFCIDYRKLNLRTIKDAYAIPRIEDTLHLLAGSRHFSTLDLKAGYWQVELKEEDKCKTAFQVGTLGFYECNRMPFGLCNAPATFQRLMERCMGDLNLRECLIYLDDIIIFSETFDAHLDRLEAVFDRLRQHNLKLKPSKCEFFKTEVTYLGHIVSADGIKTDPGKINAIKDWPVPHSVKDVRRFLGFSGYYRKFVKNYASIVRPLNDLLIGHSTGPNKPKKKKQPRPSTFEWKAEQQDAFATIIDKLSSPPVLAYAEYEHPFILHTDASMNGLGAVLYQKKEGIERVIAYASRGLKQSERNYPAHKLEFLALKWAITDKFHDYLYGATFEAVSDNNPLTYVLTTAKLDATGQRWIAALSNYNFTIKYRSGKKNNDADGLSRQLVSDEGQSTVFPDTINAICSMTLAVAEDTELDNIAPEEYVPDDGIPDELLRAHALSSNDWRRGQMEDRTLARVIHLFHSGQRPSAKQSAKEPVGVRKYLREWSKFSFQEGVLYRTATLRGQKIDQLVLPASAKDTVLGALHDDLGHQGRDRTTSLVKERYYWTGMDGDIQRKVKSCDRCIRQKVPVPIAAELVPISSTTAMGLVCIDYLSLETSKGGYENVLVITDHFTRYAQAIPTRNQTARTTARVLFDNFFVHYGFPSKLHSDRGANFESKVIKHLCKIAKIRKTRTTPYHPMGNGQVERFNQTLIRMLGTLAAEEKRDWKSHIPTMTHAYNATVHESTGFSPFYLMFGRQPRLAIDAFLGIRTDAVTGRSRKDYAQKLESRLKLAYRRANDEAVNRAGKYKAYYDVRVKKHQLRPGDRVLSRNVGIRGKHKLADRWEEEPYIVVRQPDPDIPVYEVRKEHSMGRVKTVHRNHLLPFMSLPTPSDMQPSHIQHLTDVDTSDSDEPIRSTSDTSDVEASCDAGSPASYRIPMRRRRGEPGLHPRSVPDPGQPAPVHRPTRTRRPPQRYGAGVAQQHTFTVDSKDVVWV